MGSGTGDQVESRIKCNIIAIPYPGRGHINPMMNLCKLIASTRPDILITFVVTEEWHKLLSSDPNEFPPANIQFGTIPNVLPSETSRGKNFSAFLEALFTEMGPEVESFLDRIEIPNPSLILSDTYLRWALKIGKKRNIDVASFWTTSATMFSILHHYDLLLQNGHFTSIC
ncbi:hypothetical protein ACH5RR_010254 [Cinchona calisaya]|uniref:Uncharacterized protein n=1 Tax=Cinchona calisaya TaxID=153742 RepID=A0ABD3AI48_9GENT